MDCESGFRSHGSCIHYKLLPCEDTRSSFSDIWSFGSYNPKMIAALEAKDDEKRLPLLEGMRFEALFESSERTYQNDFLSLLN